MWLTAVSTALRDCAISPTAADVVVCTACDALAISWLAETIVSAVSWRLWNRSDWFATRLATSWTLPAMSASSTPRPPMRSAS